MKLDALELRRQFFHFWLGIAIVLAVSFGILTAKRVLIVFIVGVVLSLLSVNYNIPVISWFLKHFDRKGERIPGKGAMFFVLGSLLVLAIFPGNIALASILVLSFGDAFATLVGMHLGRVRSVTKKTLEGFFAGLLAGFLGALFFVDYVSAFAGSAAAMCFELLTVRFGRHVIDDNLMVPMISGLVMYVVFLL